MAYDPSDIRSQLNTATKSRPLGSNVAPQYFEFDKYAPNETSDAGSSTWWVRSQACVFAYTDLKANDPASRPDQLDEYMVLVHDPDARTVFEAGGERVEASGRSLVIMPPGDSSVTSLTASPIVRLFSTQSPELNELCHNNDFYAIPDPNVAEWQYWPDPPDGFKIRVYDIDAIEPSPDRFGRIFRCTTLMVNYIYAIDGPRDPAKLSPHHHDDFEQLSLQMAGDYVHHIRTPWVPDSTVWREDEHQRCTSPSVTVIPPPSVHTSEAVDDTHHQLIDIFAPPRMDFSQRPGWVLNADEYPVPELASTGS